MILDKLLARGDSVSIERGRLVIKPSSGLPVPDAWIKQHRGQLIAEIARSVGVEALEFVSHSVGTYGKAPGVTLQFVSLLHGGDRYCVFNVDIRRARNTTTGKVGALLPYGQFRVGERSGFWKFWLSTGMPYDRRSNLHRRMGNLRGLILTADTSAGERLDASTLKPMEIPAHKLHTSRTQLAHNSHTSIAHKETQPDQQPRGLQPNRTTGAANHGKRQEVIRECGNTGVNSFPTPDKKPEEQTVDEWLADYSSA